MLTTQARSPPLLLPLLLLFSLPVLLVLLSVLWSPKNVSKQGCLLTKVPLLTPLPLGSRRYISSSKLSATILWPTLVRGDVDVAVVVTVEVADAFDAAQAPPLGAPLVVFSP